MHGDGEGSPPVRISMANARSHASVIGQGIAAILLGGSIGWLVGLSVSETVASVVAGVLGLLGGAGALVAGGNGDVRPLAVDLRPVAALGIGIAVGATSGMVTRSHGWLTPEGHVSSGRSQQAVLYGAIADACAELRGGAAALPDARFRDVVVGELGPLGRALERAIPDDQRLRQVVTELCRE